MFACRRSAWLLGLVCLAVAGSARSGAAERLGKFAGHGDIGAVSRPLQASYDPAAKTYTIGASGADIWGTVDAFGFVWNEADGDVALTADIAFVGESKQGHRKGCLMFRQALEPNSPYVDVAVHGDGLISLQFRREAGGPTRTIAAPANAPQRVRLEKRGDTISLSLAGADGRFTPSGCAVRLPLAGKFFVGLAVSAHDNTAFETARFSHVELGTASASPSERTYAVEVVSLASLDRRVVFRSTERTEAPVFSPDGTALYFNRGGRLERLILDGGAQPVEIGTGPLTRINNDRGISPDGRSILIGDTSETGQALMYLLPIEGGAPQRIEVGAPAYFHGWSPDGKTITYCAARGGEYDVYTLAIDGGRETRLTTRKGNDNGPEFSADGHWIYYHAIDGDTVQVWRMRPDGSGAEAVTRDEYYNWFPHPSPDGKWIAVFSSKTKPETGHPPDGDYVLRLLPVAGGEPREVARFFGGNGSLNSPCWSRDSREIAYAVFEPERK